MAIRKRFNPIDYYGGSRAARKPLSVAATRGKYEKAREVPLGLVGNLFKNAAGPIADAINAYREEKDTKTMQEVLGEYRRKQGEFPDPNDLSGVSSRIDDFASGNDGGFDDEPLVDVNNPQAVAEYKKFYADELAGEESRYSDNYDAGRLGRAKGLIEPGGRLEGEGGPRTRDMISALQGREFDLNAANKVRDEKRAYDATVAKGKIEGQIKAAQAKPGTNPTSYKEWKLSKSNLSYEEWMEKQDLRKIGLSPAGSGEPPTVIPGSPADIKQQRIKLQETSNALTAKRVALMEQKGDPEYIKRIEHIKKGEGYLIGLQKSRPKARGAVNTLKMKGEKVAAIIADALPLAKSMFAAGPGAMLSSVWNTDSRKLAGLLTNLKAVIGFDTLAEMRANSPTGGALGQVSNIEINLLQAVQGTLDQGQQELLIRSLTDIKGNYPRLLSWAEERFKEQYVPLEEQPGSSPKVIRLDVNGNIIQ